jgi:nucleoside-diphosphate-sugar epimerase
MLLLLTGATGKVGSHFLRYFLADDRFADARVRAVCHNRLIDGSDRVDVVRGSIADRDLVEHALVGVSHVVHLATCKETPEDVIDVTVKGLFWMLEAFRASTTARQFIVIGGDAAVGHFHCRHPEPITEATPHRAYPGCYARSKVLEEVMTQQYVLQYGLNACCLRAPWIMEKDDFRYTLSFGDGVFGAPVWKDIVGEVEAARYRQAGTVPVLLDADGEPLQRNFIHVDDLASAVLTAIDHPRARGELFNICMDRPINYRDVAAYLKKTRGLPSVDIPSNLYGNWMSNDKAKYLLSWRPEYDMKNLVDSAWEYKRPENEPRTVWYPG